MRLLSLNLRLACGILGISLLVFGIFAQKEQQPILTEPNTDLTVDLNGTILQGGVHIGHFSPTAQGEETAVLGINSDNPSYFFNQYSIGLPLAIPNISSSITSIQDTGGMFVSTIDPTTIQVVMPQVIADSHTEVTISIPPGYLHSSLWLRFISFFGRIPALIWFGISLFLILLSLRFSKAKEKLSAITPLPNPPNQLPPAEIRVLMTGHFDVTALTALLFNLAERGHAQFIENGDDIFLIRSNQNPEELLLYEEYALRLMISRDYKPTSLAEVILRFNQTLFSNRVGELNNQVYGRLTKLNYFSSNPQFLHVWYKTAGIILQSAALIATIWAFFLIDLGKSGLLWLGLASYIIGVFVYRSSYASVPLSEAGLAKKQEVQAFERYLSDRNLTKIDSTHTQDFFHYYAHAIALGVENNWPQRFSQETFLLPSWFTRVDKSLASPAEFVARSEAILHLISLHIDKTKDPNVD